MRVKVIKSSSRFYGYVGTCKESKVIPGCYLVKLDRGVGVCSFVKDDLEFIV